MKNIFRSLLFSAITLIAGFAVSCTNDEEIKRYEGIPPISVSPASITIPLAGGQTEAVTITTPAEWVLSIDNPDVLASVYSGYGNAVVQFEVPEAKSMRTIKATVTATGYMFGYPITKKASIAISQSDSDIPSVDGAFVYYEDGGESVSKVDGYWPYVDKYEGWNPQGGEGFDQSGVTYTGKNASVRNSGKTWAPVGSTYATDAPYAYLQAKTDSEFVINNIAISNGVKNYTFSFTAFNQYASLIASPYTPVVAALESGKNLTVSVSVDGSNWGIVPFTTMEDGNWTYAIAPFTLPADADKLYVKFFGYVADTASPLPSSDYQYQAALRFDDFRLVEGGDGPVVEFNNAGGGSTEAVEGTIEAILAGGLGNYTLKNAWVVATYAQGFIATDATGKYILCYQGSEATVPAVGTVVEVSGAVVTYGGLPQFDKTAVVTATTETKTVNHGSPAVMTGADLDKYVQAPEVKYAQFEGALSISSGKYYNVTIDGATTAVGSISYPATDMAETLKALDGKGIKATGYMIGVTSGRYTNMMITAVEATGNDPEPTPDPEPMEGTYTLINSIDQVKAGTYYMAGYAPEYNNQGNITNFAPYSYHMWTGGINNGSSGSDLMTVNYSYTNGVLQLNPDLSAQDAAKGTAQLVELVAVNGKANTYYIKFGEKYLTCTGKRAAALVDSPVEWAFSAHPKGGICLTDNNVILGTAGATYNLLRCYVSPASSLLYGVVFFTPGEGTPTPDPTPDPTPTPGESVAINTITSAGTYTATGTVVAIGTQAYIIADNTGAMMVYHTNHGRTIGENITISGDVTIYQKTDGTSWGTPQFSNTATVVVNSTGNNWTYNPTILSADGIDEMMTQTVSKEVQFTGTLVVDGNYINITFDETNTQGSIKYVDNNAYSSLNGQTVTVKGYFVGVSSNKFVNVLPYAIEGQGGVTPNPNPDPTPDPEPDPTPGQYTSVADFLAAPEDETTLYTLKGTITAVANSEFGNFDLTDQTGTVLIYGLNSPDGTTNKYWAASGAKLGDDIVVKTVRSSYGSTPQGKNAHFVEVITPGTIPFWSFEKTIVSFLSEGGEQKVAIEAYNLKESVNAISDNAHFTVSYADGVLTIVAPANTSSETINGNITVTCGTLSQVVKVSQNVASSGEQQSVDATISFADKTKRTSYTTAQQVWEDNGIIVVNDKDASTTNVGDYAAPARFYKSSKVTITAPGNIQQIEIDCAGMDAKYVDAWVSSISSGAAKNNNIVTITLDGSSNSYIISLTGGQARANSMKVTFLQ